MSTVNPLERLSDAELVGTHSAHPLDNHYLSEMTRRLKDSLNANEKAASALAHRVEKLNMWLFAVTVAVGAMTLVQAAAAGRTLVE